MILNSGAGADMMVFLGENAGIAAFAVKLKRLYHIQRFFACGAEFRLSLLNSISVILSGFSLCLRRGTFVGRKYPKASAFLEESSQRTKKKLRISYSFRYLFPVAAQNSAWVASRRLRRPFARLRSSSSLLHSACAVLSGIQADEGRSAAVKIKR